MFGIPRHAANLSISGILLFAFAGFAPAEGPGAEHKGPEVSHWGYSGAGGPEHWGDLQEDFAVCKEGRSQSPIDIRHARTARLHPIGFHYRPAPLHIVNNGHTVMVEEERGGYITVGRKRYNLVQFHFHHSSEERIEGKAFGMDVHLVHRDASGNLAVVAILIQPGEENGAIRTLWRHLPLETGMEYTSRDIRIDPSRLLPATRGYYTFTGSLTTPPCTEHVTWFVLRTPIQISLGQMQAFGKLYPANVRPVQPLNGRPVLASR